MKKSMISSVLIAICSLSAQAAIKSYNCVGRKGETKIVKISEDQAVFFNAKYKRFYPKDEAECSFPSDYAFFTTVGDADIEDYFRVPKTFFRTGKGKLEMDSLARCFPDDEPVYTCEITGEASDQE